MMARPVIGSAWQPARFERRDPISYSALRPKIDRDQSALQTVLLADAKRRAYAVRSARSPELKRALVQRVCFDLVRVLRGG
jgi:hypothetical protein